MKSLFTLITLLFTLITNAQTPPGGDLPPRTDPNGMPICMIGCFAGCSPISPSCQTKNLGSIEQAIEDGYELEKPVKPVLFDEKSFTIIKDNTITFTKISKKSVSHTNYDLYTGQLTYISKSNNKITEKEHFFKPLDIELLEMSSNIETQLMTGDNESLEKNMCGSFRAAVLSAMDALEAAVATGNQETINAANNLLQWAYIAYVQCVLF